MMYGSCLAASRDSPETQSPAEQRSSQLNPEDFEIRRKHDLLIRQKQGENNVIHSD